MIKQGTNAAFDMADARLKFNIQRMTLWANLLKAKPYAEDPDVCDLYFFYIEETQNACIHIVNWCWEHEFIDRDEAHNINHWLHWFDDPEYLYLNEDLNDE